MTQQKPKIKVSNNDHKCIVCCEKLLTGAKKCVHCDSYQAEWKNRLSYVAGILGLITATIAAGAYIYSSIQKEFFWEDKAAVYEYYGDSHIVISNFGDGAIFVKGLNTRFESESGAYFDESVPLNVFIDKGTVKHITLPNKVDRQKIQSLYGHITEFNSSEEYNLANNFSGTYKDLSNGGKCYLRTITEESSTWIKTFKRNAGEKFYTSNGTGTLQFYSMKSGDLISKSFNVQSYLQDNKNIGCALTYKDESGKTYALPIK